MGLTFGGAPLAADAPETVNYRIDGPAHKLFAQPFERRVRGVLNGETVVDSERGMLLYETGLGAQLYVPLEDIRTELLTPTNRHTHCPFKGDASYWTVTVGDRVAENAVWHYPEPIPEAAWLRGFGAFYWGKLDSWYDEDEEVFGHLRDPYHRVDIRASSRHVVVRANDVVLAESDRPFVLSETGFPTRYYLPADDVRREFLRPTETSTICPYKGTASYVGTTGLNGADGTEINDVAWRYERPLDESLAIADAFCFDDTKVTVEVTS